MMELTKSILLNVFVDEENLGNYSSNGIIFREDVGALKSAICNEYCAELKNKYLKFKINLNFILYKKAI